MPNSHKETGYYERPPSRRERELAIAERELKKMLEGLDSTSEDGIVEANNEAQEHGENE